MGGVFLRLLVKQPNWSFRKPKEFLTALTVRRLFRLPDLQPMPIDCLT